MKERARRRIPPEIDQFLSIADHLTTHQSDMVSTNRWAEYREGDN